MDMFIIIWTCISLFYIGYFIYDTYNFRKFCSKLQVGTKLRNTCQHIYNEFNPNKEMIIEIIELGEKQVKVKLNDNTQSVMYKRRLFVEKWKFI